MLSIGDFARLGQVSVRMLRHYDRIGVLRPAHVAPTTGYRSYDAAQLARLNRVVALKDLGFPLEQVRQILDDDLAVDELRGMLRLRRAELAAEHAESRARLSGVEQRLRLIEKEHLMSQTEYVHKPLAAVRLAGRRATASSQPEIGTVVGPLFDDLAGAVRAAGGSLATPLATYELGEDDVMRIVVGYAYAGAPATGFDLIDLPASEDAVCAVHLGSMETIGESWQALAREVDSTGLTPAGPCRELYVRADPTLDQSEWVTELQQPVIPVTAGSASGR
jgi:DNA-binding transcriptional MerR regulator